MAGKKFRFTLERVLKLRTHETERARQHLAAAQRRRLDQEELVAAFRKNLDDLGREAPGTGTHDPNTFRQFAAFRMDAQRSLDRARRDLQRLQQTEKRARDVVLEKRRAEEALLKLREDEEARHLAEEQHADIAFLDDQAISGYFRNHQA